MKDNMEIRDNWEKIVRSKLEDFEVKPEPDDWKAIAGRLSGDKPAVVMKPRRWIYWAAAVILCLLLFDGGYRLWRSQEEKAPVADISQEVIPSEPTDVFSDTLSVGRSVSEKRSTAVGDGETLKNKREELTAKVAKTEAKEAKRETILTDRPLSVETITAIPDKLPEEKLIPERLLDKLQHDDEAPLIAEVSSEPRASSVSRRRRWGFGMGGGSYSVGNSGAEVSAVKLQSNSLMDFGYRAYTEKSSLEQDMPEKKLDVKHNKALSFGLGISYMLTDRWALQSGVTYAYMTSTWRTEALYQGKVKQRLHFIGIPLGISYKIAEWERFRFYTGAGIMSEWNVAGSLDTDYYYGNEKMDTRHESVRMKEWQWSVNGRAGVSYPLFRYMSAYVEGNASYYFKNGSTVETLRSENPFYVSLQAGLRLGF